MRYIIILLLIVTPMTAIAGTYYFVDIDYGAAGFTGLSSVVGEWNGSQTEGPWATQDDAVSKLHIGDTAWVRYSTYIESVLIENDVGRSWTEGSYVSIVGVTDGWPSGWSNSTVPTGPIIEGSDYTTRAIYLNECSYWKFDSLHLRKANNPFLSRLSSAWLNNVTVTDSIASGATWRGIVTVYATNGSDRVDITNCDFSAGTNAIALLILGLQPGINVDISDTLLHDSKAGIHTDLSGTYDYVAELNIVRCSIYDNIEGGIFITRDCGGPVVIDGCRISGHSGTDDYGIYLGGDSTWNDFDRTVRSSIIYDNYNGVYVYGVNFPGDFFLYNNTFSLNNNALYIEQDAGPTIEYDLDIYNNIFSYSDAYGIYSDSQTDAGILIDNNCYWSNDTDMVYLSTGPSAVTADPQFANATTNPDEVDLTRTSSAPCWAAGTNVGTILDFNSQTFPDPPAIGAYYGPEPTSSPVPASSPPPTPYFSTPTSVPATPTPQPSPTSAVTPTPAPTATSALTPTPVPTMTPIPSPTSAVTSTPIPTATPSPTPSPADMRYRDLTGSRTLWVHWSGGTGPWGPYVGAVGWQYDHNISNTGGYWCDQWDGAFGPWATRPTRTMMTFEYPPTPTPIPSPTTTPATNRSLRVGNYW